MALLGNIQEEFVPAKEYDDVKDFEKREWASLTYEEKNRLLFLSQKRLLDMFLERNAISKAQYEKSLHDLTSKLGAVVKTSE